MALQELSNASPDAVISQVGFKTLADALGLARFFQLAQRLIANLKELLPLLEQRRRILGENLFRLWETAPDAR